MLTQIDARKMTLMTSIEDEITLLVARACGVDPKHIRVDRSLIEYGLDSVRAIDLLISLETSFGIEIPDQDVKSLKSVKDVAGYIRGRTDR
jgi:acyl carrier protein